MNLSELISLYIAHKRALGYRFLSEDRLLRSFCRAVGDRPIETIGAGAVSIFLNGKGSVTTYWYKKYHVLTGCYRFALARGLVPAIPLPRSIPKQDGPIFVPYIYSHTELKRLIDVLPALCAGRSRIDDYVFKTLLLLMYGAGLRISEALSLHIYDVDMQQTILYVRETKFYKTRIVPLGKDLTKIMNEYIAKRNNSFSAATDAPFFCFRDGTPLSRSAAHGLFRRVRAKAGVIKEGCPRHQPRLHDLRHSAAVHRLVVWYRSGADLHDLLPKLATYLGHVDLSATQRYLTMTPELLHEASLRFAHYALEKDHD